MPEYSVSQQFKNIHYWFLPLSDAPHFCLKSVSLQESDVCWSVCGSVEGERV